MKKDSWLLSDNFLKRCFAIWGHYFVAQLIISGVFMVLFSIFFFVFGLFFATIFSATADHGNSRMERDVYESSNTVGTDDMMELELR